MIRNIMNIFLLPLHARPPDHQYDLLTLFARPPDHEDDHHKNMIKMIMTIFLLTLHGFLINSR